MNILITGAKGNIGSYLCEYLKEHHNIYALGKKELDVTNKDQVYSTLELLNPSVVIHTAGLTNIDFCENNETAAYTVNTLGSLNLAYACSCFDIPLIYLSTNQVYKGDGTKPYYETDDCEPINVYGKTKLAGEKLIRTICKKYFILRTSWVFGGHNCYVRKALEKRELPIFLCSSEIVNPTYIKDLAYVINCIMDSNFYGVYNCVNSNSTSKLNLIKKVFQDFNIQKNLLELPDIYLSNCAPRPKYSALNTSLLKNCFNIELPSWEHSLSEYEKELIKK